MKPRRSANILLACALLGLVSFSHTEPSLPQKYPLERYDSLRKHLPFGKPTVIETEAAKPPPFTEDLALLGFSKVGSNYFVTLTNKKTQQKVFLSPKEAPNGITVSEVINHTDLAKVEIKLKKGDEIASIKFDPTFLAGQKPGTLPFPNQGQALPVFPPNLPSPNGPTPPPAAPVPISQMPQITSPTDLPQPLDNTNGAPNLKRIRRIIVPTQAP